jgi:undecaprenyl diphosphate synthase
MSASDPEQSDNLPEHIAIIMDGNGRWARAHGRRRHTGHREGVKATRAVVEAVAQRGIKALTLFAFSSENWNRPHEEVSSLMSLFVDVLKREVAALDKNGIRIRFIGAREALSSRLQKMLLEAERQTAKNNRMDLVLAVAYGGRWDILQAVRELGREIEAGKLTADEISEQDLSSRLSLAGLRPPDLLIRTGGEHRVSNFLLWDMAYSEFYFTDTLWPEFGSADLEKALAFYAGRQRRFGQTGDQIVSSAESV